MGIPTNVTEVKAFLGCCGQMASYCQYYAIVAEPLHRLTRKLITFPKPWIPGTDYDIAFHKLKGMMLDSSLFLWNKVSGTNNLPNIQAIHKLVGQDVVKIIQAARSVK